MLVVRRKAEFGDLSQKVKDTLKIIDIGMQGLRECDNYQLKRHKDDFITYYQTGGKIRQVEFNNAEQKLIEIMEGK